MDDDWRLQIEAAGSGGAVVERLQARELEHDLDGAFDETVIVSRDDDTIFLYAGTRPQIERVKEVVERLASAHGWTVSAELTHWHPDAEEWEGPDVPLPRTEAEREEERDEAVAEERAEVAADGEPVFEVRVELGSRGEAKHFADLLEAEGLRAVQRWKYLVVGAGDEEEAKELAERLREEAPQGSEVKVEGSGRVAWAERPPNPFAIFGGLGT